MAIFSFYCCLFAWIKQCFAGTGAVVDCLTSPPVPWEQPCSVSFLLWRQCGEALGGSFTSLAKFFTVILKLVLPLSCCLVDLSNKCTHREQDWFITRE